MPPAIHAIQGFLHIPVEKEGNSVEWKKETKRPCKIAGKSAEEKLQLKKKQPDTTDATPSQLAGTMRKSVSRKMASRQPKD